MLLSQCFIKRGEGGLVGLPLLRPLDVLGGILHIEGPLDLSYQELTDISLLTNLSDKVTSIDLTGNKIEVLPEGMLDNLVNLETFYASSNLIGGIPEGFFKNNGNPTSFFERAARSALSKLFTLSRK